MNSKLYVDTAPREQVEDAIELIYSSGPEMFDYVFSRAGKTAKEFLHFSYQQGDGLFGNKVHRAVFDGEKICGIGAFYSGRDYGRLERALIKQMLSFYPLSTVLAIAWDSRHVGRWMKAPDRQTCYVADLGVRPERRGQGLGGLLLAAEKQRAQEAGFRYLALDVVKTNPRAEALYSRFGFQFISEQRFTGRDRGVLIPNARRMQMSI